MKRSHAVFFVHWELIMKQGRQLWSVNDALTLNKAKKPHDWKHHKESYNTLFNVHIKHAAASVVTDRQIYSVYYDRVSSANPQRIWNTVYVKIFAWQKFCQPQIPLYCRNIWWNKFSPCGKGRHILYVIINTGQKFAWYKFRQWEQVAKLAKIFSWLKFPRV